MQIRQGELVFIWTVTIDLWDGTPFITRFISNYYFMTKYILSGDLPVGIKAPVFEDYEVEDGMFESMRSVCTHVNNKGGFQLFGWIKYGEVQDQGVDRPNNGLAYNAPRYMVQTGTLDHHKVRIDPLHPEAIDLEEME